MKNKIIQALYATIDEINELNPEEGQLEKSIDTVLLGAKGTLDSLGLVNFIIASEEKIEDEFEISITLADERAMSKSDSPFRTIGTLSNYIEILLLEENNG